MSKDNIIVVRRKGRRSERRHGGSWKIAYADFMTAMMAFFLVMWILTLVPREELKEIADYFRMPLMEAITGGARSEFSHSVIPGETQVSYRNLTPLVGKTASIHAIWSVWKI
ncbi:flagellar motor protein MotB [Paenalcaligenes hominis]|uniref:flagellar motor protein MotB n=1 Tax=Paenalcaligenes hominis TaxID=643674 RepID=UPI00360F798F